MHCAVCAGLQDCDRRYMENVLNRRTRPERISESLAGSLGFCGPHTAVLQPGLDSSAKFRDAAQQAAGWLLRMVADVHVFGERLNEILFRSRGACPACLYRRRMEGRLLSRFLGGAPASTRPLMHYLESQLCLNHLYAIPPQLLPPGKETVAAQAFDRALRRLRREYPLWDMDACTAPLAPPAGFAARRAELARIIGLSSHVGGPCADARPAAGCACLVCDAVRAARDQWRQRLGRTIELGYPLRLAAPACPTHVVGCLVDGSAAAGYAAWSRFLQPDDRTADLAAGPVQSAPPVRSAQSAQSPRPARQRKGASWHLASPRPAESEWEPARDLARLRRACPACCVADIARLRAVLRFNVRSRSAPDDACPICVKHFAEAYILEARGPLRLGFAVRRMAALQAQAAEHPVWAFGQFS